MDALVAYIAARGQSGTRAGARGGSTGSGTAISVAILFPALMVFIMVFDSMAAVSRTGEAVQSAADRAARTAALCCLYVDDAEQAARDSVEWLESVASQLDLGCANDLSQGALVYFEDPNGAAVGSGSQVPEGGTVRVRLECDVAYRTLGSFAVLPIKAERNGVGTAAIDPYRYRVAPAAAAPATGLHLQCHLGRSDLLTLHWADPEDSSIASYEYRTRSGPDPSSISSWGNWTAIPGGGTTTSHPVTGLTANYEHHFQLRAKFTDGSTAQGPQNAAGFVRGVPGKPPEAPSDHRAIGGNQMVTLKWDDQAEHPRTPDSTITGYRYKLWWSTANAWRPGNTGSDIQNALSIPGGATSFPATHEYDISANQGSRLSASETYRFTLWAENDCGHTHMGNSGPVSPTS